LKDLLLAVEKWYLPLVPEALEWPQGLFRSGCSFLRYNYPPLPDQGLRGGRL